MTVYAGESVQVTAAPTDFDGTVLTSADVTSVTVTIVDSEDTVILSNQGMIWDSTQSLWLYKWDTGANPAGSYKARVKVNGLASTVSWEFLNIRLHANKF